VNLAFRIEGDVDPALAVEAARLSQTRFCAISAMLSRAVPSATRCLSTVRLWAAARRSLRRIYRSVPAALSALAFARALLAWYDREKRDLPWRHKPNAYRTLVSELMLQQTVVAAVVPYFARFMARFPLCKPWRLRARTKC